MPDSLTINPHAKANLFLRILAKETSGFHQLETLFTLLELHDELTAERIEHGVELEVAGADTGPVEENLAYRAAQAVLQVTGGRFGVRLHLIKHTPVRAGLGGGSSDAAAALHAVNALADNAVPHHEILQIAAKLGSDVPFLATGAPLAIGWGRGERLMRIPPPTSSPVLIAVPAFGISTAKAYDALRVGATRDTQRGSIMLDEAAFDSWGGIGRLGGNDFESVVFGREPALKDLFERIAGTRPLLVRMSGSGSAIVAVYKNERDRDGAALEVGERDWRLIRTATRATPAPGPEKNG
jgi:4-diphosphocytidyl-2-C-methyl-D-erythritol kinase